MSEPKESSMDLIKRRIIRAKSWNELFSSKEQEMADFIEHLVGSARADYESIHALRNYRVKHLPEGDLHVFEHTEGYSTTYQKLRSNGNVWMTFYHPDGTLSSDVLITPDIGNMVHDFTFANTILPDRKLLEGIDHEEFQAVTGLYLNALFFYIEGKPATKDWENSIIHFDHLPQRIGHRIFPSFVLEAQTRLQKTYPQLFK